MADKKKFEINVNAKEENCKTGDDVIDEVVSSTSDKVDLDCVQEAEPNKAEEVLGDISLSEEPKEKEEVVEKVEAEVVQDTEILENSNKDEVSDMAKEVAGEAASLLNNIKDYINGSKFDETCEKTAKKTGVKKEIVKNAFVKNILRGIADTLGLVITTTGNLVIGAVNFIDKIIASIINFSVDSLMKLINMLTLNCGTITK